MCLLSIPLLSLSPPKHLFRILVEWLNENKIMEQLYVHSIHPELLKRAVDIPKFFALHQQIKTHHIDLMWSATVVSFFLRKKKTCLRSSNTVVFRASMNLFVT